MIAALQRFLLLLWCRILKVALENPQTLPLKIGGSVTKAREFVQSPIKRDRALPDSVFFAVFSWKILRLPLNLFLHLGTCSRLGTLSSDWLLLILLPKLDSKFAVLASSAGTWEKNWEIRVCDNFVTDLTISLMEKLAKERNLPFGVNRPDFDTHPRKNQT